MIELGVLARRLTHPGYPQKHGAVATATILTTSCPFQRKPPGDPSRQAKQLVTLGHTCVAPRCRTSRDVPWSGAPKLTVAPSLSVSLVRRFSLTSPSVNGRELDAGS